MAVASVSETVQVLAESPTIDVRQATAATNIRAEEIDRIPKGRDFQSLVTLAPGANHGEPQRRHLDRRRIRGGEQVVLSTASTRPTCAPAFRPRRS